MPSYSRASQEKLRTCHPSIQIVFSVVIKDFDNTIVEGVRTVSKQKQYVQNNVSKTMNSYHLCPTDRIALGFQVTKPGDHPGLSRAVDAVPYPIDWSFEAELLEAAKRGNWLAVKKVMHSIQRWSYFAGHVMGVARARGIHLVWGGDWDGDKDLADENFDDWPHFQVRP